MAEKEPNPESLEILGLARIVGAKVTTKMQTTIYLTERELLEYTNHIRGIEARRWKDYYTTKGATRT